MDTPSGRKKHALITGASSGIGKEIAKALAAEGYRPILVGRHRDTLEQAAHEILGERGADAIICPADLSEADAPMMHRSPRRAPAVGDRDGRGLGRAPGSRRVPRRRHRLRGRHLASTTACSRAACTSCRAK
ncbi:MAG TPA: SDR family NAD(P)-dependent oxidoreductase [Acidisphaera sp.]|nr:SDR family NAD(P)-dependent oxidoreductase [Acidisphaera sp.]HME27381.1 SDR family NAD(P)-dependent oxidoreductase [Acetobacteraceae bacterium]